MTPDETSPSPVDEQLLADMMAFDALLHDSATAKDRGAGSPPSPCEVDDRGRSRLLLLLRMLEATEPSQGLPEDAPAGRQPPDEQRPLLGRFDVLDDLGAGGFGFVVRAATAPGPRGRTQDALAQARPGPGDVHRFLREARAAARLDHPHIVRVFDAGELGPLGYFIASEFCPGRACAAGSRPRMPRCRRRLAAAVDGRDRRRGPARPRPRHPPPRYQAGQYHLDGPPGRMTAEQRPGVPRARRTSSRD